MSVQDRKEKKYKGFKCGKPVHLKKDCRSLNNSNPQGNVASTSDDGNSMCYEVVVENEGRKRFADVWMFNTRATFHMIARRERFHHYKPIYRAASVYICNDRELKINEIRSIMVKMHDGTVHTIQDVGRIKGLKKNLFSLGRLSEQGIKILVERKLICGFTKQAPIQSIRGAKYFLTFIDDYSRRC
nr:hypothetical protein [Tanacetum cinerariifolium]